MGGLWVYGERGRWLMRALSKRKQAGRCACSPPQPLPPTPTQHTLPTCRGVHNRRRLPQHLPQPGGVLLHPMHGSGDIGKRGLACSRGVCVVGGWVGGCVGGGGCG